MVPLHRQLLPKQTCTTGSSRIWNTKVVVWLTAAGKTSTSATWTSLSSALMSSAIWRPLMCTSLTSTFRSPATPLAPPACLQTTTTGSLQRLAALTLPHTATRASMGQCGAARAPCPPPLPPVARWANTGSILKQSNWAPATTASTPTGHPHTLITAPTVARPVSLRPRQLPQLQRLSPAPSVTILTSRAPTITTLIPATLPASTSILTSTHPGGPTVAQSSTACPWLLPTAPPHPAGISLSTPHCLGLEGKSWYQRLIPIDALLMKEVRSRWFKCVEGVVGYLWPFEHETKKVPADFIQSYIVAMKTHLYRLFTQRQTVLLVSQTPPWGNVAYAHILYILYIPPSFQFKTARACTFKVKQGSESSGRDTLWLNSVMTQMETGPIMWTRSEIYINGHLPQWISLN